MVTATIGNSNDVNDENDEDDDDPFTIHPHFGCPEPLHPHPYPPTSSCMVAPGLVSPGHMMLAPDSTNLMAPLSVLSFGIMSGYWCRIRMVGNQRPSRSEKNRGMLWMMATCM